MTRALLFIATTLGALWLAFFAIPAEMAEWVVLFLGYPLMFATTAGFGIALWRLQAQDPAAVRPIRRWRREYAWSLAAVAAACWFLLRYEPFQFKILNDEILLAGAAQMMHFERLAGVPQNANVLSDGSYLLFDAFLDKRPLFFPFVLATLHDLTGFRAGNSFLLNGILTVVLLSIVCLFARRLSDWRGGVLVCLLLAGLPLLGSNATSGHFEMLNLVMLAASFWLGLRYLEQPEARTLTPFALGLVLLAQTRYESVIFLLPLGVLILIGWRRAGRVILPAPVILAPLLLVLFVLQYRATLVAPNVYWQPGPDGREAAVSLAYFGVNLQAAHEYLFALGQYRDNSALISVLGMLGFGGAFLLLRGFRRPLREAPPGTLMVATIAATALIHALFIMIFYWGVWNMHVTARLSLSFQLCAVLTIPPVLQRWPRPFALAGLVAGALFGVYWVARLSPVSLLEQGIFMGCFIIGTAGIVLYALRRQHDTRPYLLAIAGAYLLTIALPAGYNHRPLQRYTPSHTHRFLYDFLRDHPRRDYLMVVTNPVTAILFRKAATPLRRFAMDPERAALRLKDNTYSDIFICLTYAIDPASGDWKPHQSDALPEFFETEVVREQRRYPNVVNRIVRLTAVHPPPTAAPPAADSSPAAAAASPPEA
jgi:hypothetical protein